VREDHFSKQAAAYAAFRPTYPDELFAHLAEVCGGGEVWDCATGSGQAALGLAEHFARVHATDASAEQIRNAPPHPRVTYSVAPAEASGLAPHSIRLVTVAQALHWFDLDAFYAEVRRVLEPGGRIAIWSYGLMRVTPEIDALLHRFHDVDVGPYWPEGRWHVVDGYARLAFPFAREEAPEFRMLARWDLPRLVGYLTSWSAVQRAPGDPVAEIAPELRAAWGAPGTVREVRWPLLLRLSAGMRA
jgi:SAM-dependent methyltransferase